MSENKLKNLDWAEIPTVIGAVSVSGLWLGLIAVAVALIVLVLGTAVYFAVSKRYRFTLGGVKRRKNVRYSRTPHIRKRWRH
jgi:hypothetical protein